MNRTIRVELEKPARKSGGDRYKSKELIEGREFQIYIPQEISRTAGIPAPTIAVTFSTE